MISVLIIAHNESSHIAECIESVLAQSLTPDEVILIVHNSHDTTADIARGYKGVRVFEYHSTETGPLFARIYGFQQVSHEIIACIDGDSVASPYWLAHLTRPFLYDASIVATGGYVRFVNNPGGNRAAFFFFLQGLPVLRYIFHFYFWGANFACRKISYDACGGLTPLIQLRKKLHLHYHADDCYLSFALGTLGTIRYARDAEVLTYPGSFFSGADRGKKQREDRKNLIGYFSHISK